MAENIEPFSESIQDWLLARIASALNIRNKATQETFKKKVLGKEENQLVVNKFLADVEEPLEVLYVFQSGGENADIFEEFPSIKKFQKKGLILMNLSREKLTKEKIVKELVCVEVTKDILQHLYGVFNEIMSPICQNPENQIGWTDLVTKDLMEKFNAYIAQVYVIMGLIKGRTMLPMPSHQLSSNDNKDTTPNKDKAHVFEGSIITWTKQIKNVLKLEPEQVLKNGDPGPLAELEFWKNKSDNLNSIHEQLQSQEVKTILKFLETNKSTYTNPFSKLRNEVQKARIEANDNNIFLSTLRENFEKLEDPSTEFTSLPELFTPIMHTILRIWNESRYYKTPPRLVVLIREICNAIITSAKNFVDGQSIFDSINAKETAEACEKLQTTIDVCTKFKDAYFDYKAKAGREWKLTTNALFVRLDSFIERGYDIKHLTETIVQFNKLERIELGGTKGKTLTESIQQIFQEFEQTVETFTQVKYDIIDISENKDNKKNSFDDDFYDFRSKIKELERRLASVITQGFDDYDTIYGRFKLLDNFEGLLNRPIIQDELEKKHIVLLEMYKQDLKTVQSIFLDGKVLVEKNHDTAPIFLNMPPIAGALTWCKSLRDRIQEPIDKLAQLGQGITDREEFKDVQKLYHSITKSIKEYEDQKIHEWHKEVEANSEQKLQQTLLCKDENGYLKVNFDPSLVRLLREVKYFLQLEQDVPKTAADIYAKATTYRKQIVSLDMIVGNYNHIIKCLHPVEEPLVKKNIQKMEVEVSPGVEEHKWKSPDIDKFIATSKNVVETLYETVKKMKNSLENVKKALQVFNTKIIDRKSKPMSPDDYDQYLKAVFSNKIGRVKEQGGIIHKLVKEVLDAVKTDKKGQSWKNYNDYVNSSVIDGIASSIITALTHLNQQIDPDFIKKSPDLCPLFDIALQLDNKKGVVYEPELVEDDAKGTTVRNVIKGWINDFFTIAGTISRLDSTQLGDYLQEIRAYFEVKEILAQINMNLDECEEECYEFKKQFDHYSQFWLEDPKESFEKFLDENQPPEEQNEDDQGAVKENPLLKGCRASLPPLPLFDERITQLKTVQQEISKIPTPHIIRWLKIDLKPMRQDLNTKVQQWYQVYTEFLLYQFKTTLKNLQNFIENTNDGIAKNPSDEENINDNELLMKVMKVISDVKDVEQKTDGIIKRLKDMVMYLKKHNVVIQEKGEEDPLQAIDNSNSDFTETVAKVFKVKADIIPLQRQETIQIQKQLKQFQKKVEQFREEFLQTLPFQYDEKLSISQIQEQYLIINEYHSKTIQIEEEAKEFNKLEKLFELTITHYKQLKECHNDLKNLKQLWDSISMVNYQYNDWKIKPWRQIKADTLEETNKKIKDELKNMKPKEVKQLKGHATITDKVKNMTTVLPLVSSLHSDTMEDRHWASLKEITGKQFDHKSLQFTFDDILNLHLYKYDEQVNDIVDLAGKEHNIEKKLKKIETDWNKQIFEFTEYRETKIFQPLDDILEMLDQDSLNLMSMKAQGRNVEYFIDIVESWREKLSRVDVVANEWLKVQKNWRMLVNIFLASEDIRMQLPEDTKLFETVDKEFRDLMNDVQVNPNVIEACTNERKEILQGWSASIKKCEKSLNDYLEQKKKAFPRFYFISNQSLLTILSNGQNAPKVCEYLGDCFDGLKGLKFNPPAAGQEFAKTADQMYSKDNEIIDFQGQFVCEGAVEKWLKDLEYKMRLTLQEILEGAKEKSELWGQPEEEYKRHVWLSFFCAQIALLTTQIVWTEEVEDAFQDIQEGNETAMKELLGTLKSRLADLIDKVRSDLHPLERGKIINIITIDVHGRDVVDKFILKKVQELESFDWQSQLKFYYEDKENDMSTRQKIRFDWEKDKSKKKCIIRIVDWHRFYSYEYVGNAMRLVVTPLTDRCYITLTQALNLTMGGAPAGPAGTGKTETTKDLGRGVGLPVMVFNCSDQMNKDSMAQIFMGLSQSGAWGCFDEFNRISIEVLSVVSTQVKCVLDALKEKQTKFHFMEEGELDLQDTVGFFITMNPGYAGRTELPENLKALFRSCAMVVPDLMLICENMLMSEGFNEAKSLSRKFVSLYMLSRELLSKQRHYDWGLRAVKSVLRQAGGLKRADPDMNEDPLLMRALRDFNMPKIVTDDKSIFLGLIGDLFPKQNPETKQDPELQALVKKTCKEDMGLVPEEGFVTKVVQLKEIMEVRHCVFVIGPPGCGKTCVWKCLCKAHTNKGEVTEYDTLNPKAVTSDELFGAYTKTKEWKNGVIAVIMKNQVKNEDKYRESQTFKWTILDGDIDPEWIESLNTVMDDNKVLTLVSNDRIPLTPQMRLIFEISNLKNATPATVSRAGVLFINETDIGWMPYMNQWLDRSVEKIMKKTKEGSQYPDSPQISEIAKFVYYRCFQQYFEQHLPDLHDKDRVRHICPMVDIAMVQSICCIIDALMMEHGEKLKVLEKKVADKNENNEEIENLLKQHYEAFFIFAGLWSIGGMVGGGQEDEMDMKAFNSLWKGISKIKFPEQGLSYDYYWGIDEGKWTNWSEKLQSYIPQDEQIFSKIFVSTIHTSRLRYLLDMHLKRKKQIMFIGSAGTGKTAVMKNYLSTTDSNQVTYTTVNFSSFTDSLALQKNIENMVEKKAGTTFGSATNKIIICFIDDLNMPYVDKYGTQSPIALLRQIIDYGQIFNRDQLEEKKYLQDLLFFSCQNQKAGSFQVDLRLQRNYSVYTMYTPSQDIIKTIFGSILNAHFNFINPDFQKLAEPIIDATNFLFKEILKTTQFSPSARRFHYQFNFRELSKIIEGVCRSNGKDHGADYKIYKLWVHECFRTFSDRMINTDDTTLLQKYLVNAYTKFFNEPSQEEEKNPFTPNNIHTEFISIHEGHDPVYKPIQDFDEIKKILEEKLEEYNETKAVMNLVLFGAAIEHIARITRILDMPGGNALLVGVGGSGKQSLTRLSSFILTYEIDQMVVTSNFSLNDLKTYLQEIYKKIAKPSAAPRVFMLTDQQIKQEVFLIPINDMLNSGWIFDLFPKEDFEGMVGGIRGEAKGLGIPDNLDALQNYFLDKIRKNLKVVLCFSPVGEAMRIRSRKFPGIINSTIIDWFHPWPKDALIDVAGRFISDIDFPSEEIRNSIAQNMADCHSSIDDANATFLRLERRYNYTTPKSFLELIDFYKKVLGEKRDFIDKQIQKYQMGLNILDETQSKVAGLKDELNIKMVDVNKKKAETDVLIEKVNKESEIAAKESEIANEEEAKTNEASQNAKDIKEKAEVALEKALPALEQAKAAVDCLKKNHVGEMKALGTPPDGVKLTARVILILLGERITLTDPEEKVWKKCTSVMNNPSQFLDRVQNFNGEQIDQHILDQCNKIIQDPNQNYNEKAMIKQNFAASKLCLWSVSIVEFNRIFKEVKPLQDALQEAEDTVATKQKELAIVKEKVRQLNEKVAKLERDLEEAETQKRIVEEDANACEAKLIAAEKLVNGLAGENKRWTQNVKDLKENILSVIGDALLASEFVSYIGAFSAKLRSDLWKNQWLAGIINQKIPITAGIEPLKILTTEAMMAQWKNENLPADTMSLENAAVITSCSRWPLMIDPQLKGSNWVRGKEGENLTTISMTQNKWLMHLSNAITEGKAVMIEGIQEEIDATLDPLLQRAVIKKGKSYILELGGETIDYNMNFKLFLITKLTNPHFRPEIAAQCTIINFIVTESGLEEQLLATVVNIERNELEMQKQELVKKQNEYSVTLDKLESSLLESLASADSATILENKELIETLDVTKKTTVEIQEQSQQAKKTETEINIQREHYRPVAAEGAMLYFLVIALCFMDHMYQYSLESFNTFFLKAINQTKQKGEERIDALKLNIRKEIYQWISRGLFERHKLIFLTLITFRLMQKKNIDVTFEQAEMDFLIKATPKPGVECSLDWLPRSAWDNVQGLIQLEEFKAFAQNLEKDAPNRFKEWYNEMTPEKQKLPLDWKKLDSMPFKKLLVLRCLRPDRITVALTDFIQRVLPEGQAFVEMDQNNTFSTVLHQSINDADSTNPIFFILSPGSDPVKEVEKIAKIEGYERGKTLFDIALGQGQDEIAKRRIDEGNREGHWVMLQNIHLMPTWLIELEKILDSFAGETGGGNSRFKLFLSAEPSKGVPIGILDRSIKLTNEPPAGLKANMTRAWTYFPASEIEEQDPRIKAILFALCFFHSTLIERKRFGPKGWNMSYPFNMGDLRDSYAVMNRYLQQSTEGKVPFADLIYIFGEIMYGGHIVDNWDRILCNSYLFNLMDDKLFDECELFPYIEGKGYSFKVPGQNPYDKYIEHIEQSLATQETPLAYGLHPNAEIGFRTTQCINLFNNLQELQPKDNQGDDKGGDVKTPNGEAQNLITYVLSDKEYKNKIFNVESLKQSLDAETRGPYQNVFLQELEYMNVLLVEITKSLEDISQGFQGLLTISERMEAVIDAIFLNKVPASWSVLAWPSKRGLASWLINLEQRHEQLDEFKNNPIDIPKVIMISRFFNPQSFLTAILQVIGRQKAAELNKLYIATEITKKSIEEVDNYGKEGSFVYGFILEGARWDYQSCYLEDSKPKEMFSVLPVVYCKAMPVPAEGKEDRSLYQCPSYKTEDRGNTYVFTAQLRTRQPPRKWILAGVAIIMDVEGVSDITKTEKKQ